MKMKKLVCLILVTVLLTGCLSVSTAAKESNTPVADTSVSRATGQFTIEIPANGLRYASTKFPLEYGEIVSIRASFSPYTADVSYGLIDSDNIFSYLTTTGGIIIHDFIISKRDEYTFAIKNNSSYPVSVTGYVTY